MSNAKDKHNAQAPAQLVTLKTTCTEHQRSQLLSVLTEASQIIQQEDESQASATCVDVNHSSQVVSSAVLPTRCGTEKRYDIDWNTDQPFTCLQGSKTLQVTRKNDNMKRFEMKNCSNPSTIKEGKMNEKRKIDNLLSFVEGVEALIDTNDASDDDRMPLCDFPEKASNLNSVYQLNALVSHASQVLCPTECRIHPHKLSRQSQGGACSIGVCTQAKNSNTCFPLKAAKALK